MSLRVAAETNNVKHTALYYRIKNRDVKKDYTFKYHTQQVFSKEQEMELEKYLLKSSRINYGLTYEITRKLAYEYAKLLKTKMPDSWERDKKAGVEWMKGFMERHPTLSLRKPENTSLSRATSFNPTNVSLFQENYKKVMEKYMFSEERLFNLDETGIMTVVQAPRVIAGRGIKQVGQVVSGERGKLVTMCAIICANGNPIPPVFVFPRARMVETLMHGAPSGSLGFPNSPESGWMTSDIFLKVLKHLCQYSRSTKEDPILLLMDNHETHCNLEAIQYAKQNGIVLLTFPPHCSHRLQPLDVGVYGPFKEKFKVASNDWMLNHPGRTISIHNVIEIARSAYERSFTISNIKEGFKKPGIWPVNRNAFSESDFDASYVTDRPLNDEVRPLPSDTTSTPNTSPQPGPSHCMAQKTPPDHTAVPSNAMAGMTPPLHVESQSSQDFSLPTMHEAMLKTPGQEQNISTPDLVRPYPKVTEPRKKTGGRKKGSSKVLTDTPVKNDIENDIVAKIVKKVIKLLPKNSIKKGAVLKTQKTKGSKKGSSLETQVMTMLDKELNENAKKIAVKRKIIESESEEDEDMSVHDSSSDIDSEENFEDEVLESPNTIESLPLSLAVDDFILVKFNTKKTVVCYVAQVEEMLQEDLKVKFLRKIGENSFSFPEKDDRAFVALTDVVLKLPQPIMSGGTLRAANILKFNADLSRSDIR